MLVARPRLIRRLSDAPVALIEAWLASQRKNVESLRQSFAEMRALPQPDFATLSVALQAVRRIAER